MIDSDSKKNPRDGLLRARQYFDEKRFTETIQICTAEIASGTNDPEFHLILAQCHMAQNHFDKAKQEAAEVVRLDPVQADAHRILAEIACNRGELATACKHLERVLELDPDDNKSRYLLETLSRSSNFPAHSMAVKGALSIAASLGQNSEITKPHSVLKEADADEENWDDHSFEIDEDAKTTVAEHPKHLAKLIAAHVDPFSGEIFQVASTTNKATTSGKLATEEKKKSAIIPPADKPIGTKSDGQSVISSKQQPPKLPSPALSQVRNPRIAEANETYRNKKPTGSITANLKGHTEESITRDIGRVIRTPEVPPLPSGPLTPDEIKLSLEKTALAEAGPPLRTIAPPRLRGSLSPQYEELTDKDIEPASAPLPKLPLQTIPSDVPDPIKARQQFIQAHDIAAVPPPKRSSEILPRLAAGESIKKASKEIPLLASLAKNTDSLSLPEGPKSAAKKTPSEEMTFLMRASALGLGGPARKEPSTDKANLKSTELPQGSGEANLFEGGVPLVAASDQPQEVLFAPLPSSKPNKGKTSTVFRWVIVAFVGLLIGGGGFTSYLWYRSYTYVQEEWKAIREWIYQSTPEGYRQAINAAERIIRYRGVDEKALAAIATAEAALAVDLGEDRIQSAREILDRSKGSDSEWRTAANAFLNLLDDPAHAEGYLQKGLEVYPQSALLHYLRGRAFVANNFPERAQESFTYALRLAPQFVAARIAQANLKGLKSDGFSTAFQAFGDILKFQPNHAQVLVERARLCVRHHRELDVATGDIRRVLGFSGGNRENGQVGWAHLILGQIARYQNDYSTMSNALDQAMKSPPCCDPYFRYEIAGELMKLYRLTDAKTQMKAALAFNSKQPEFVQRMGRILLDLEDPESAVPFLQAAPVRQLETRLLMGRLAFIQGNYARAEEFLRNVLNENRESKEAAIYWSLTQARQNRMTHAVSALEKLAAENPENAEILKALGLLYFWNGNYGKSASILRTAGEVNRLDPAIPTMLGHINREKQQFAQAKQLYQQALTARTGYYPAKMGLAWLYLMTGELSEARNLYDNLASAEVMKPEIYILDALLDLAEGKLEAAKIAYAKARQSNAPPKVLARLEGELALTSKDGKTAQEALKRAAKLYDNKDPDVLVMLGQAQMLTKNLDAAYDSLHLALKLDPEHPLAMLELGRIALNDGEYGPAFKYLNDSLTKAKARLLPTNKIAAIYTTLGQAYLQKKDTGQAITNFQEAIDLYDRASDPYYFMGVTYDMQNKPQRAVNYYDKALHLDPHRVELYELLGYDYAKIGDKKNAIKNFEDYLRTKPPATKAKAIERELAKLKH